MINFTKASEFNEKRDDVEAKYPEDIFDALCMRYEYPDAKNRWDSPLFILQTDSEINFKEVNDCLFDKKPPPPNMSTQNVSNNYLVTNF